MRSLAVAVLVLVLVACAPTVDGPIERQRAADRADGDRLALQLRALPGVVRAEVVLHRLANDPLATTTQAPPSSSIVVVVDDRTDKNAVEDDARSLSRAIAPEIEPTIVVEAVPGRAPTKSLKAALAVALAVIALLAGWLAWGYRARLSKH